MANAEYPTTMGVPAADGLLTDETAAALSMAMSIPSGATTPQKVRPTSRSAAVTPGSATTPGRAAAARVSRSPATAFGAASPNVAAATRRVSVSSESSIFERSVDNVATLTMGQVAVDAAGNPTPIAAPAAIDLVQTVPASHAQLVVDNQIPAALDASVEAIIKNEDLDKIEIVTAKATPVALSSSASASRDNLSLQQVMLTAGTASPRSGSATPGAATASTPHVLASQFGSPSATLETDENLIVAGDRGAELPADFALDKRISFVSFADLVGVEQREAAFAAAHARTRSRDSLDRVIAASPVPGRSADLPQALAGLGLTRASDHPGAASPPNSVQGPAQTPTKPDFSGAADVSVDEATQGKPGITASGSTAAIKPTSDVGYAAAASSQNTTPMRSASKETGAVFTPPSSIVTSSFGSPLLGAAVPATSATATTSGALTGAAPFDLELTRSTMSQHLHRSNLLLAGIGGVGATDDV